MPLREFFLLKKFDVHEAMETIEYQIFSLFVVALGAFWRALGALCSVQGRCWGIFRVLLGSSSALSKCFQWLLGHSWGILAALARTWFLWDALYMTAF